LEAAGGLWAPPFCAPPSRRRYDAATRRAATSKTLCGLACPALWAPGCTGHLGAAHGARDCCALGPPRSARSGPWPRPSPGGGLPPPWPGLAPCAWALWSQRRPPHPPGPAWPPRGPTGLPQRATHHIGAALRRRACGQNEAPASRHALAVPRRQPPPEAPATPPGRRLAATPWRHHRLPGPACGGVAAIAAESQAARRRSGPGGQELRGPPAHEPLYGPRGGCEPAAKERHAVPGAGVHLARSAPGALGARLAGRCANKRADDGARATP
jgi:hypothetical protein